MGNYKKEESYTIMLQHDESMKGYLRLGNVASLNMRLTIALT